MPSAWFGDIIKLPPTGFWHKAGSHFYNELLGSTASFKQVLAVQKRLETFCLLAVRLNHSDKLFKASVETQASS